MTLAAAQRAVLELVRVKGSIQGRKVLQKLCYFLQEGEGVPLGLNYRMHYYGPYSEELDSATLDLAYHGLLSLAELEDGTVVVSPGEKRPAGNGLDDRTEHSLRNILNRFGNLGGLTLELLATAHFLARVKRYEKTATGRQELADRIQAWKGSKFERRFVLSQIARLEDHGYL